MRKINMILIPLMFAGLTLGLLAGCNGSSKSNSKEKLHPFLGCWENDNGLEREVWNIDPSGWLFGHAVNRNEAGDVTFFEQMRISTQNDKTYLIISGSNGRAITFRQVEAGPEYIFENVDHDYPQRITYTPENDELKANISMLDGSKKVSFNKSACH